MKKQLLALTAMLAIAGLSSCGPATEKMKVGLLTLHGTESTYDKNFIDAFNKACDAKGVEPLLQSGVGEDATCTTAADKMVQEGAKLIFADSFGHEDPLMESAKKEAAKDVQFCHATGYQAAIKNIPNFHNAFASIYEGRYLAGVAAGLKLQSMIAAKADTSKKIGYVGAFTYAEVVSGLTSWYLGVKSIVSDVTMDVKFTGSWYDEDKERDTANALIDGGCSIISQHADSMGAPNACDAKGVPNITYNDATNKDTYVISSRINWQPYFEHCIDAVKEGKAIETNYTGSLKDGSVEIGKIGPAAAEGTEAKIAEVKAALEAGTTKVFDCSTFTLNTANAALEEGKKLDLDADGHIKSYSVNGTNVIKSEGSKSWFAESEIQSAPYFDLNIDGITYLNVEYGD
ncbi:MAG: BMP family ABC transporter substrate-binding protein [Bacilli bacterium]|nr:BMP family ABC transporter substrate-binding protein [Bacilli bacterium]